MAQPRKPGDPQVTPQEREAKGSHRDPEERDLEHPEDEREMREKQLDKTLADSFPTSDPPSSIPDPSEEPGSDDEKAA